RGRAQADGRIRPARGGLNMEEILLVDYLEDAAAYLREKREKLHRLEETFKKIYDRDIKKEMAEIKVEIRKKQSEVNYQLLLNLEEFRALNKYYGDLLRAFMEDEHIGKVIGKKAWLLDFRPTPPKLAAAKLQQIKEWRSQLRDARSFLRKWVGRVDARSIVATYPVLRGHMSGEMDKEEALAAVDKADRVLLKEGWLLLISDSLIQIPIAKFMTNISRLRYEEVQASHAMNHARGRGTVAETAALRKFQEITRKRQHYEKMIEQVLLANPKYLKALKKDRNWLAKNRSSSLDKLVQGISPKSIKERVWLNRMRKKLEA
ncbi:MAG: hypothetical protein AB1324_07525, partial [Candidatus Micrarchaeota archaeon]